MKLIRWRAVYNDGSVTPQYCRCGFPLQYPDIDRTRLTAFDIYEIDEKEQYTKHTVETGRLLFRVWLEKNQRLIYRRRVTKDLKTGKITGELWLVGYQEDINGTNKQVVNYVFPDGHVEQAGKWVGGLPSMKEYEV